MRYLDSRFTTAGAQIGPRGPAIQRIAIPFPDLKVGQAFPLPRPRLTKTWIDGGFHAGQCSQGSSGCPGPLQITDDDGVRCETGQCSGGDASLLDAPLVQVNIGLPLKASGQIPSSAAVPQPDDRPRAAQEPCSATVVGSPIVAGRSTRGQSFHSRSMS